MRFFLGLEDMGFSRERLQLDALDGGLEIGEDTLADLPGENVKSMHTSAIEQYEDTGIL